MNVIIETESPTLREKRLPYKIVNISEKPELVERACKWFSEKWKVPYEAYMESMNESLSEKSAVPQWYLCLDGDKIIGGMGVIDNDFHERKDLAPNVCAVYTEPEYRCKGIAGELLNFVFEDMKKRGIHTLYLVTDHTSFYERYGWEYLCDVKCDDGSTSRMYERK